VRDVLAGVSRINKAKGRRANRAQIVVANQTPYFPPILCSCFAEPMKVG